MNLCPPFLVSLRGGKTFADAKVHKNNDIRNSVCHFFCYFYLLLIVLQVVSALMPRVRRQVLRVRGVGREDVTVVGDAAEELFKAAQENAQWRYKSYLRMLGTQW